MTTNPQKYICESCDFITCNKTDYNKHLATDKHKSMTTNPQKFICESCDYITSNKKDYKKHLATDKHKSMTTNPITKHTNTKYCCEICDYITSEKQHFHKHLETIKHKRNVPKPTEPNTVNINKEVIMELLLQNQEFKNLLITQQQLQIENQRIQIEHQNDIKNILSNCMMIQTNNDVIKNVLKMVHLKKDPPTHLHPPTPHYEHSQQIWL